MTTQRYSLFDRIVLNADQALRTVFGTPVGTGRANPATATADAELSSTEKSASLCLMRVNHAGEVCAQALYQGQALTARRTETRTQMEQAALEENDHLAWCQQRVQELGGSTSLLNPLWYAGSLAIGAASGLVGDQWSLGFLAETEQQVVKHLDGHLQRLPSGDQRSKAILQQMKADEAEHRDSALRAGGRQLPETVRKLMALSSKLMTMTAYRI
jgi:ubiquinone biosynthesis monooxygenase Coq7